MNAKGALMRLLCMENEKVQKGLLQTAGIVFIGILLALVLKISLDTFFKDVPSLNDLRGAWSALHLNPVRSILYIFQLLVFIFTVVRFYLGAYRYHEEQAETQGARDFIVNFVGAIAVFVALYVAGMLIKTTSLFYVALVILHVVDLAWFIYGMNYGVFQDGLRMVAGRFVMFDIITLVVLLIMGALDFFVPIQSYIYQFVSLTTLAAVGTWDFVWLWPFYANKPGWQK